MTRTAPRCACAALKYSDLLSDMKCPEPGFEVVERMSKWRRRKGMCVWGHGRRWVVGGAAAGDPIGQWPIPEVEHPGVPPFREYDSSRPSAAAALRDSGPEATYISGYAADIRIYHRCWHMQWIFTCCSFVTKYCWKCTVSGCYANASVDSAGLKQQTGSDCSDCRRSCLARQRQFCQCHRRTRRSRV